MAEFSEHQTTQLDTIITNETQKFLDSLRKEDFSIAGFFGNLTINPIKNRIKNSLTSKSIKNDITNFVGLNFLGKLIVTPELIDRVNTFKKEIISMRMRYDVEHIIPTNEELNQLRETIGVTKRTAEDSQKLRQKVNNGQQNPPRGNPRPPQRHSSSNTPETFQGSELPKERIRAVCDYISGGGTYYSPSKGYVTWGEGIYKGLCTTGTYAALALLISNASMNPREWTKYIDNTAHVGYDEKLRKMHCYPYIKYNPDIPNSGVDPDNPGKSGYVPKIGDVAVRDPFPPDPKNKEKKTQHMAIYTEVRIKGKIERRWVSDTIQNSMSCYSTPTEPHVSIYRYSANSNQNAYTDYRLAA